MDATAASLLIGLPVALAAILIPAIIIEDRRATAAELDEHDDRTAHLTTTYRSTAMTRTAPTRNRVAGVLDHLARRPSSHFGNPRFRVHIVGQGSWLTERDGSIGYSAENHRPGDHVTLHLTTGFQVWNITNTEADHEKGEHDEYGLPGCPICDDLAALDPTDEEYL